MHEFPFSHPRMHSALLFHHPLALSRGSGGEPTFEALQYSATQRLEAAIVSCSCDETTLFEKQALICLSLCWTDTRSIHLFSSHYLAWRAGTTHTQKMKDWTRCPRLRNLEALCNSKGESVGTGLLGLFSISSSLNISFFEKMDEWMDGCVPLLMPQSSTTLTKNGTDGGPGAGWHSGYQMACHNRSRWTQALILFLLVNRWINSKKKKKTEQ